MEWTEWHACTHNKRQGARHPQKDGGASRAATTAATAAPGMQVRRTARVSGRQAQHMKGIQAREQGMGGRGGSSRGIQTIKQSSDSETATEQMPKCSLSG